MTKTGFKSYIAQQVVGKRLKFKCDCLIRINFVGVIQSVTLNDNEFLYQVQDESSGRVISIGSNHPNLYVTEVESI